VGFLTSNKPFNFGADAAHDPDPGIFLAECFLVLHDIAAVRFVLHIADPWLRSALSEYSCIFWRYKCYSTIDSVIGARFSAIPRGNNSVLGNLHFRHVCTAQTAEVSTTHLRAISVNLWHGAHCFFSQQHFTTPYASDRLRQTRSRPLSLPLKHRSPFVSARNIFSYSWSYFFVHARTRCYFCYQQP